MKMAYVVLFGMNGVSKPYRTIGGAKEAAQRWANARQKTCYVDFVEMNRSKSFHQHQVATVRPNRSAPTKRRAPARRSGGMFGGFNFGI